MTSRNAELDLNGDVEAFFGGVLEQALQATEVRTSHAAKAYLVGLMADFADPGRALPTGFDNPFTLELERALESKAPERFDRLRRFGDSVLYASGFFAQHLARRGVPVGYVKTLGSRAYLSAASALSLGFASQKTQAEGEGGADSLFIELADKFGLFVVTLEHVAENVLAPHTDRGTLELYERWLRTGSQHLAENLARRGLLPFRGDRSLH